jgi:hypothetical protein
MRIKIIICGMLILAVTFVIACTKWLICSDIESSGIETYICLVGYTATDSDNSPFGNSYKQELKGSFYMPLCVVPTEVPNLNFLLELSSSKFEPNNLPFDDFRLAFILWNRRTNNAVLFTVSLVHKNVLTFYFPLNIERYEDCFYSVDQTGDFYQTENSYLYNCFLRELGRVSKDDFIRHFEKYDLTSDEIVKLLSFFESAKNIQ